MTEAEWKDGFERRLMALEALSHPPVQGLARADEVEQYIQRLASEVSALRLRVAELEGKMNGRGT